MNLSWMILQLLEKHNQVIFFDQKFLFINLFKVYSNATTKLFFDQKSYLHEKNQKIAFFFAKSLPF